MTAEESRSADIAAAICGGFILLVIAALLLQGQ
jgi:hypothetical protein